MTTSTHKFFLNKKFFIYLRKSNKNNIDKSAELIKLFGGEVEQFLECGISYVLTDIPKSEWPPDGSDQILMRACQNKIKLMSIRDVYSWCTKYINSQSSSDDDEEQVARVRRLQSPYLKIEDQNCFFSPSVKEFNTWPKLNLQDLAHGRPIFCDTILTNGTTNNSLNNSAQITPAVSLKSNTAYFNINHDHRSPMGTNIIQNTGSLQMTNNNTKLANLNQHSNNQIVPRGTQPPGSHQQQTSAKDHAAHRGVKRKHGVFCEVCNLRLTDRIEEHILTPAHQANIDKTDWSEVSQVIDCLPSFSTLNKHRLSNLHIPKGVEYQEFLCLHKMDSVSQLFHTLLDR